MERDHLVVALPLASSHGRHGRERDAVWRVQCAWCRRFKANDGRPVGQVLPIEMAQSHGICTECAKRYLTLPRRFPVAAAAGPAGPRRERADVRPPPQRKQPSPLRQASSTRVASAVAPVREERPVWSRDHTRKAHIVEQPGLLELRDESGRAIRSVIFVPSSLSSKEQAHGILVKEAMALGYSVVEER